MLTRRCGRIAVAIFASVVICGCGFVRDSLDPDPTPFEEAVNRGDLDAARKLISAGEFDISRDRDGTTVLTRAIFSNNPEMVRLVVDHGAQVHEDGDGLGWEYNGAAPMTFEMVRLLLDLEYSPCSSLINGEGPPSRRLAANARTDAERALVDQLAAVEAECPR